MGRDQLYRLDLASGKIMRLEHPQGSISGARVRPDGAVWYRWSSGATPPQVRVLGQDQPVLLQPGPPTPGGVPYESWAFTNPAGQMVHGFLALPTRPGPHPTVILIHGGPQAHYADSSHPEVQAWVDHDYAVALVNYRGSTGYGKAWQSAVEGDPGRPEVEDVVAGRDDLIVRQIADPDRVVIAGVSWGGYVTLQTIGTIPVGWRAAIAVSPVADYVSAYADEAEALQALDRTLFGGSPEEKPDFYRERSPITYAHQVTTPVLLVVGENDIRCPLRQALNYADRLRDLGKDIELGRFDAGHAALVVDERIRRMEPCSVSWPVTSPARPRRRRDERWTGEVMVGPACPNCGCPCDRRPCCGAPGSASAGVRDDGGLLNVSRNANWDLPGKGKQQRRQQAEHPLVQVCDPMHRGEVKSAYGAAGRWRRSPRRRCGWRSGRASSASWSRWSGATGGAGFGGDDWQRLACVAGAAGVAGRRSGDGGTDRDRATVAGR